MFLFLPPVQLLCVRMHNNTNSFQSIFSSVPRISLAIAPEHQRHSNGGEKTLLHLRHLGGKSNFPMRQQLDQYEFWQMGWLGLQSRHFFLTGSRISLWSKEQEESPSWEAVAGSRVWMCRNARLKFLQIVMKLPGWFWAPSLTIILIYFARVWRGWQVGQVHRFCLECGGDGWGTKMSSISK